MPPGEDEKEHRPRLDDKELRALVSELTGVVRRHAPGWTDGGEADPGVTLLELLAFVLDILSFRETSISDRTFLSITRVLERLARLRRPGCVGLDGLTRPSYFSGRLLTAEDLRAEQDYQRGKLRLLGRLSWGTGIVRGLEVSLESATAAGNEPVVVIEPGCAIGADGEPLLVPAPLRCRLGAEPSAGYVTLHYFERPRGATPTTDGAVQADRIEEGVAVRFESEPTGVVIARLERHAGLWRIDPQGRPAAAR